MASFSACAAVGSGYRVDQNPMDHDNDGVPDEDIDGTGRGSYDEDDDNDGRIDQFTWPCDFDSDGLQDYFDLDDDALVIVLREDLPDSDRKRVEEAARSCPVSALVVED